LSTTFKNINILNFREITDLLRGKDERVMCVWHACDPWNTSAVQGLEGDGSPSHCTRTNKDGIDWLPAEGWGKETYWQIGKFHKTHRSHERQLSLYVTPQEHGGCKDCRFWSLCMGQCPGTGDESVDGQYGDWRLRSSYCQTWKDLFEEGERRLLELGEHPISKNPIRPRMEQVMYEEWKEGREISLSEAISRATGKITHRRLDENGHGDHFDVSRRNRSRRSPSEHGDHADQANHTNITPHGDHTNLANANRNIVQHGDHINLANANRNIVQHGDHHENIHGDSTDEGAPTILP